uniref:Odorant receptor 25 n=1 Tax=Subpsaltria yangi TaxID=1195109 RepID=A0A385IUT3_9HEMI|nr:odorant receptor 25 [Subpsaltria yangi]
MQLLLYSTTETTVCIIEVNIIRCIFFIKKKILHFSNYIFNVKRKFTKVLSNHFMVYNYRTYVLVVQTTILSPPVL